MLLVNIGFRYGIKATDSAGNTLKEFSDVFTDRCKAEKLANSCNKCELSIVHFEDVIEDALVEC